MQTKITADIWQDSDFLELGDESKLVFFWILTNVDQCGFVEMTPRKLRRDIESPYQSFEALVKGLPRAFIVKDNRVWVRNYIAHQLGRGASLARNNITKWVVRDLLGMSVEWQRIVCEEYPELIELLERQSVVKNKPLPTPCQGERDRDRDRDRGGDRGGAKELDVVAVDFGRWWDAYPAGKRKVNRKGCLKKWRVLAKAGELPELSAMLEALASQRQSRDWQKDNGDFVPQPMTYLNQGRWDVGTDGPSDDSDGLSWENEAKRKGLNVL